MKVGIITIGDELLLGHTVDTNSVWLAIQLEPLGYNLKYKLTVSDNADDITESLDFLKNKVDVIIISGGLGPTNDDVTKKVLVEYCNTTLVRNEMISNHIAHLFRKKNKPVLETILSQADVPANCELLFNEYGTAPGMLWNIDSKIIVALPGVPHEFKKMIEFELIPRLTQISNLPTIIHKLISLYGIGESKVSTLIEDIENALPKSIHLAYLPQGRRLILRLSQTIKGNLSAEINLYYQLIQERLKDYIIYSSGHSLEYELVRKLTKLRLKISTAESCTGGLIGSRITDVSGSSSVYLGGIIAYDNRVKQGFLDVDISTLENYGAVSEETVKAMVEASLSKFNADCAISVSGILGPNGGTESKPVGTVWIAWAFGKRIWTEKIHTNLDRHSNKSLVVDHAIVRMLQYLNNWEYSNT